MPTGSPAPAMEEGMSVEMGSRRQVSRAAPCEQVIPRSTYRAAVLACTPLPTRTPGRPRCEIDSSDPGFQQFMELPAPPYAHESAVVRLARSEQFAHEGLLSGRASGAWRCCPFGTRVRRESETTLTLPLTSEMAWECLRCHVTVCLLTEDSGLGFES